MKNVIIVFFALFCIGQLYGQPLTKDFDAIYKKAEKLKDKKEYNAAVAAYEEVLRGVNHVPSMESIGDIEMTMRKMPNYRKAAKYYQMAIEELDVQISAAPKEKYKVRLTKHKNKIEPKGRKAQSYVDDFDEVGSKKGSSLIDKE